MEVTKYAAGSVALCAALLWRYPSELGAKQNPFEALSAPAESGVVGTIIIINALVSSLVAI